MKFKIISALFVILGAIIGLLLYISIEYYREVSLRPIYGVDLQNIILLLTAFALSIAFLLVALYIASSYVRKHG